MRNLRPEVISTEFQMLRELSERVGIDALLTQGSTGNISAKIDGVLWIKASGKWMADALRDDIMLPLDLAGIMTDCLAEGVDPAATYSGASLETALHAVFPRRVVLHVHCVNTIAWAVLENAPVELQRKLEGLHWQWVPYVASGLPLARAVEQCVSRDPRINVFVLGNHGIVIGADRVTGVEALLADVQKRLSVVPREAPPGDGEALREIAWNSPWRLPDDPTLHALGTDTISQMILADGLLYPCQAIFSDSRTAEPFRAIPYDSLGRRSIDRYSDRPFLIIEGRGVVVSRSMTAAELAMMHGLAQVVRRIRAGAQVRYLTDEEAEGISNQAACRYRALACAGGSA